MLTHMLHRTALAGFVACIFYACLSHNAVAQHLADQPQDHADSSHVLMMLSSDELLAKFVDRGRALSETMWIPRLSDLPMSAAGLPSPPKEHDSFREIEREIVRRGPAMVAPLLNFLDDELQTIRPEAYHKHRLDFTRHILMLLVEIGDPACVPYLIDLLESPTVAEPEDDDLNARMFGRSRTEAVQHTLHRYLNTMTQVRFAGRAEPSWAHNRFSILATGDWYIGESADYESLAAQNRRWVNEFGLDLERWFDRSIDFAREHLASGDASRIRIALEFLQGPIQIPPDPLRPWRDDDPAATLETLAEYVRPLMAEPLDDNMPPWHSTNPRSWLRAFCHYGPLARHHSNLLIEIAQRSNVSDWFVYQQLRRVGGDVVMDYLAEQAPVVHQHAEEIRNDPATPSHFSPGDERRHWLSSEREIRSAFDRWAAQRFESIESALKWWEANRHVPEEERFRANLPRLIEQADQGDNWAEWMLRTLIPACTSTIRYVRVDLSCIRKHLDELVYDPELHVFRIKGKTPAPPEPGAAHPSRRRMW